MARVSHEIFLSRPSDVDVEGEGLDAALKTTASGASRIAILSAYHGPDYVVELLKCVPRQRRHDCRINLVFGFEHERDYMLARTALSDLVVKLRELRFRRLSVGVFRKKRPFHTKLYKFTCGTQPNWFIGSANCSAAIKGGRHELMVRLKGRHPALDAYLEDILGRADQVGAEWEPGNVLDLRSFFLNGCLCFKPAERPSFTFQAFAIAPAHRRVLKESLARATTVPHADPQTEGFGFDLVSALESVSRTRVDLNVLSADTAAEKLALRFRHLAIETIYGYWAPAPLAKILERKARSAKIKRLDDLTAFAAMISATPIDALSAELTRHLEGLTSFFQGVGLDLEPKPDIAGRFRSFVEAKRALLDDADRRERMARKLYVEPMPDIWHDAERAKQFENSFFEDVAIRLDHPGRSRHIVELLREGLDLGVSASPRLIRKKLEKRLAKGLDDEFWT